MSVEHYYQDKIDDLNARLILAELKLAEFGIEWDGNKYVFNGKESQ